MSNRTFLHSMGHVRQEPVRIWGKVTIGAAGACTLETSSHESEGVTSCTHTSTGLYTLVMNDAFAAFLGCNVTPVLAGPADVALRWQVRSVDVAAAPGANVLIEFRDDTEAGTNGNLTDPASGTVLYLAFDFANAA